MQCKIQGKTGRPGRGGEEKESEYCMGIFLLLFILGLLLYYQPLGNRKSIGLIALLHFGGAPGEPGFIVQRFLAGIEGFFFFC